jgi:hypothetical protein
VVKLHQEDLKVQKEDLLEEGGRGTKDCDESQESRPLAECSAGGRRLGVRAAGQGRRLCQGDWKEQKEEPLAEESGPVG